MHVALTPPPPQIWLVVQTAIGAKFTDGRMIPTSTIVVRGGGRRPALGTDRFSAVSHISVGDLRSICVRGPSGMYGRCRLKQSPTESPISISLASVNRNSCAGPRSTASSMIHSCEPPSCHSRRFPGSALTRMYQHRGPRRRRVRGHAHCDHPRRCAAVVMSLTYDQSGSHVWIYAC